VIRLFAPLLALLALAACARTGGEEFQGTLNGVVPVTGTIGQTFRPATDGVRGVDLLTATYGTLADPKGTLVVTLKDATTGEELRTTRIPGTELGDNQWVAARFDPPVPAPEVAAVSVGWTGATPVALYVNAPPSPLDLRVQDINDPYPGGELLVGGRRALGDLAFRAVGTGGAGAGVGQVVGMIRSAGGRLLRHELGFAVAWLLLLAGTGGLAVWGFRGGRARQLDDGGSREQDQERADPAREDAGRLPAELG
jgi:hypothetical protein